MTEVNAKFRINRISLGVLIVFVLLSCSQGDNRYDSFAESWNNKCPITLIEDEVALTKVHYSDGKFVLSISLNENSPASIHSLVELNEEYSKRLEGIKTYYQEDDEIGGLPFVKGVISKSSAVAQMIDSIAILTYTPESTQGYLPIVIEINDGIDTLSYTYNEYWGALTEQEWLNAIMPVEMCGWSTNGNRLPPLNDVVKMVGTPKISKDGLLRINCMYYASPYESATGKPMRIDDVKKEYFTKFMLEDYLSCRMAGSDEISQFFRACKRRGVDCQFIVEGIKDAIDYDLAEPKFIKEWKSWGGSDSIIVSLSK